MNPVVNAIIISVYNLILLSGTAYLVVEQNWSAWWFLLTVCLLGRWGGKRNE